MPERVRVTGGNMDGVDNEGIDAQVSTDGELHTQAHLFAFDGIGYVAVNFGINGIDDSIPVAFATDHYDAITRAVKSIDYAHHEIHSGDHFVVSESAVLADAGTREWLIITPNTTKWAHMLFEIQGSLDTTVDIYETSTKTAGTAMTEQNRNRNSATAATTSITHTPGGSGDGNIMFTCRFGNDGGASGIGAGGGMSRDSNEFVLKQNEVYLVRVTSASDANNICAKFDWYEHVSKSNS